MRLIIGNRQTGRTTKLLFEAAKLQMSNFNHLALLIAPNRQRAEYLSKAAMDSIDSWLDGDVGLDPARTVIEHAGDLHHRLRGRRWSQLDDPNMMHHVFAFLDDINDYRQDQWDHLLDELTMNGIAVSYAVVLKG